MCFLLILSGGWMTRFPQFWPSLLLLPAPCPSSNQPAKKVTKRRINIGIWKAHASRYSYLLSCEGSSCYFCFLSDHQTLLNMCDLQPNLRAKQHSLLVSLWISRFCLKHIELLCTGMRRCNYKLEEHRTNIGRESKVFHRIQRELIPGRSPGYLPSLWKALTASVNKCYEQYFLPGPVQLRAMRFLISVMNRKWQNTEGNFSFIWKILSEEKEGSGCSLSSWI